MEVGVVAVETDDERRAKAAPLDAPLDGAEVTGLLTVLGMLPPPTALSFLPSDLPFFLNLSNPKNPPDFLEEKVGEVGSLSFSLGASNNGVSAREREREREREEEKLPVSTPILRTCIVPSVAI